MHRVIRRLRGLACLHAHRLQQVRLAGAVGPADPRSFEAMPASDEREVIHGLCIACGKIRAENRTIANANAERQLLHQRSLASRGVAG